jgi:hypothetical protein
MPSSEAIWYYAQDDREHGPVTAAYIAGMARTGKLRPEDLVWREGMEDWRPARSIKGLFSTAGRHSGATADTAVLESPFDALPPSSPSAPLQVAPEPADSSEKSDPEPAMPSPGSESVTLTPPPVVANRSETARHFDAGAPSPVETDDFSAMPSSAPGELRLASEVYQRTGRILVIAGLLLAIFARGCELAADRAVARLDAKAGLAGGQAGQPAYDPGSETTPPSPGLSEAALAAHQAHLNNQAWAFWHAVVLLLGTVLFAVGLLPLALAGSGADRWLGISLLAVLAFAVFSRQAP